MPLNEQEFEKLLNDQPNRKVKTDVIAYVAEEPGYKEPLKIINNKYRRGFVAVMGSDGLTWFISDQKVPDGTPVTLLLSNGDPILRPVPPGEETEVESASDSVWKRYSSAMDFYFDELTDY